MSAWTGYTEADDMTILTDSDFDNNGKLINNNLNGRFGMIKFYKPSCIHCRDPEKHKILNVLSKGLRENGFFVAVLNIGDHPSIAKSLQLNSIPILYFVNINGVLSKLDNQDFNIESILLKICEKSSICHKNM